MRSRVARANFWDDPDLGVLPGDTRILFIGLWCLADREGRLEDDHRRIAVRCFPYRRDADVESGLVQLAEAGLIVRYQVGTLRFIAIPRFLAWTTAYEKEQDSVFPAPDSQEPTQALGSDNANTKTATKTTTRTEEPPPIPEPGPSYVPVLHDDDLMP